jgi:hypothetical protein
MGLILSYLSVECFSINWQLIFNVNYLMVAFIYVYKDVFFFMEFCSSGTFFGSQL